MIFSTLVPILCLFWNNSKPLDVISFLCNGLGWFFWTAFFSFDTISVSHKFVFSADLSLSFTGFFFCWRGWYPLQLWIVTVSGWSLELWLYSALTSISVAEHQHQSCRSCSCWAGESLTKAHMPAALPGLYSHAASFHLECSLQ